MCLNVCDRGNESSCSTRAVISKVQAAADGQKFVGFFLESRGLVSLEVKKKYKADFTLELHSINGAEKDTEVGGPIKRCCTSLHELEADGADLRQ